MGNTFNSAKMFLLLAGCNRSKIEFLLRFVRISIWHSIHINRYDIALHSAWSCSQEWRPCCQLLPLKGFDYVLPLDARPQANWLLLWVQRLRTVLLRCLVLLKFVVSCLTCNLLQLLRAVEHGLLSWSLLKNLQGIQICFLTSKLTKT